MTDRAPSATSRVAISFGSGANNSNALRSSTTKSQPPSSLGKRPRPSVLGHNFESDSDDDSHKHGRHEAITELGGGKPERKRTKDLVIERQQNRDWKSELRAKRSSQKNWPPPEVQAQRNRDGTRVVETGPTNEETGIQWGLTVRKRKPSDETPHSKALTSPQEMGTALDEKSSTRNAAADPVQEDHDQEAMDALMGKRRRDTETHTIPRSETDAYRDDVKDHVGVNSTLADYEAIPDGEFGAALLRGMGWDGKLRGPKLKASEERRQNQLGLGAKKLKDAEDLGQWDHGGRKKDARPPRLADYRREEEKKKAERRGDGYRDERDRDSRRDVRRYDDLDRRDTDNYRDRDRHSSRRY